MSPLPLVVMLLLLGGVAPVRIMSGTTAELYDYDEPLSRSVESDRGSVESTEKDEEGNDIPPEPKHHGYHMMPKLAKDAVDKHIDTWHPGMKQNIWELSGLFEGDIMEPHDEVQGRSRPRGRVPVMAERNGVIDDSLRWPGGEVPYYISSDFDEDEKSVIRGAMDEYHEKSCIRFRPYTKSDSNYVVIRGDAPGCWSYVGMRGGGQVVNLQGRCVQHGVAIHELLHALGFHHQQSASNRDEFVKIHWENIRPRTRSNFKKYSSFRITDYNVPYDYGSIMHYSSHAFSKNGKPTITPLDDGAQIGQRFGLSDRDQMKLNIMYGCSGQDSEERRTPAMLSDSASRPSSDFDTSWMHSFDTFWDKPFYYF
ncbi:zinc metalloproteinase nas-13-like [Macrosteles quadrilineatus]|uniref:zinc metalloproteinase nas-13-like n=1 Tax=Macrosteles quadrilineatus TaxID=74068 RepID=UPI0023E28CBB|nr:zinc metalloproteinase nas-13-like [Macrosteles quadrilineatus]